MIKKDIEQKLRETFKNGETVVSTVDGRHIDLYIRSDLFLGKNAISRHRMIYEALGDMMKEKVHALSITAKDFSEPDPPGEM